MPRVEMEHSAMRAAGSRPETSVVIIAENARESDVLLRKCLHLLNSRLDSAEVDSESVLRDLLARNANRKKSTHLIAALTDTAENILAVSSGSVTPKGNLLLGYTVTAQGWDGWGFGSQIYEELVRTSARICKSDFGTSLKWLALEATSGAEQFWQKKGFKQVFVKKPGEPDRYPLQYLHPPIDWNRTSGQPENLELFPDMRDISQDYCSIKPEKPLCCGKFEALMIKPASEQVGEIDANEVFRIIRSIYREFYFRKHRVDPKAHPVYFGYFAKLMKSYHNEFTERKEVILG